MAVAAAENLTKNYELVDSIPVMEMARHNVRISAEYTLESRRSMLKNSAAFLPVDALSTARNVLVAEERYGEKSLERLEAYEGLLLDGKRLIGEWYRKNTWEYFPKSRHYFSEETGDYYSHGLSITQMTKNALVPLNDKEEEQRRVNERVEEATPAIVRKLGGAALAGVKIRTISECTDTAIDEYKQNINAGNLHAGYRGYVPEIEKLMIRDITLDDKTGDRFEEQVAISGKYFTHDVIKEALSRKGVAAKHMDKTELHGAQMIAGDDLLAFIEHLDTVASETSGLEIFMGEAVQSKTVKDYSKIRQQAKERETYLHIFAEEIAEYTLSLATGDANGYEAPKMVENFVKEILLVISKEERQTALDIFDEQTANGLGQVKLLEKSGRWQEANIKFEEVRKLAPGEGYCGAGSCGLQAVDITTADGKKLKDKLKAEDGDSVLKDTERACKCGRKSIVYAFNSTKVNKYCESCGAFESKVTKK